MTKERAKELLPIIEAYSKGATVESAEKIANFKEWSVCESPTFTDWREYRIKPEPTYRPWTFEEIPLGAQVNRKATHLDCRIIVSKHQEAGSVYAQLGTYPSSRYTPEELLAGWQLTSGKHCGTEV